MLHIMLNTCIFKIVSSGVWFLTRATFRLLLFLNNTFLYAVPQVQFTVVRELLIVKR